MARIKGRSRETTRNAVLVAAEWAFAHEGYKGASMQVIAHRANVTAATICYHFGDKARLWDGVLEGIYFRLGQMTGTLSVQGDVRTLLGSIYELAERERQAFRLVLRHITEEGRLDKRTRDDRMGAYLDMASVWVGSRFEVPPLRARHAIVCLTHLIMRFVTNHADDNQVALATLKPDQTRKTIVSLLALVAEKLLSGPVE